MTRLHRHSMRIVALGTAAGLLVLGLAATATALQDRTPLTLTAFSVNLNALRPAELENYSTQPVMLEQVHVEKK